MIIIGVFLPWLLKKHVLHVWLKKANKTNSVSVRLRLHISFIANTLMLKVVYRTKKINVNGRFQK